jgi:tetratricopeptide (TPR) repeat protein
MKENAIKVILEKFSFKNFFVKSMIFTGILTVFSCEDVLEREPLNEVNQAIVITDKVSANAAVAGLYNELQSSDYYGDNYLIIGDVSSDIAQSIGTWDFYREMDTYQVSAAGNQENDNFYTRAYSTINVANNILEKIPELSNISSEDKDPMLGAAYFVRGLSLFDLTRLYGGVPGVVGTMGVPIITKPTNSLVELEYPSRPTLEASYAAVEQDLLTAVDLLPESSNKSIASKGAAKSLLSRLYLYLKEYEKVIEYSTDVITDPNYSLNPVFEDIFDTKLGTESIFELNFNSSDQSGIRNWYNPNGGRGDLTAHESFYEEATANPNDVRGELFGFSESNGHYQTKYKKTGGIDNIIILRIAEMYLHRAEAKAYLDNLDEIDGALYDLNIVRIRAGIGEITPMPTTKEEVLQAIAKQNKLEFAFEGHRYFDLMRTDKILEVLQNIERMNGPAVSLPEIGRAVFPIPNFELDANENLIQNEAYR